MLLKAFEKHPYGRGMKYFLGVLRNLRETGFWYAGFFFFCCCLPNLNFGMSTDRFGAGLRRFCGGWIILFRRRQTAVESLLIQCQRVTKFRAMRSCA